MKKQTKSSKRTMTISMMLGALVLAGIATDAEARRGGRGRKGRVGNCGGMLLRGDPALQSQLKLSNAQIRNIKAASTNFHDKRIDLKAKLAKQQLRYRQLMQQDQPPPKRVLKMMRTRRHLRGLLAEERVKAQLKTRAMLTPQQRQQLRETCRKRRFHRGNFGKDKKHNRRGWKNRKWSSSTSVKRAPVKRIKRAPAKRVKRVRYRSARASLHVSL